MLSDTNSDSVTPIAPSSQSYNINRRRSFASALGGAQLSRWNSNNSGAGQTGAQSGSFSTLTGVPVIKNRKQQQQFSSSNDDDLSLQNSSFNSRASFSRAGGSYLSNILRDNKSLKNDSNKSKSKESEQQQQASESGSNANSRDNYTSDPTKAESTTPLLTIPDGAPTSSSSSNRQRAPSTSFHEFPSVPSYPSSPKTSDTASYPASKIHSSSHYEYQTFNANSDQYEGQHSQSRSYFPSSFSPEALKKWGHSIWVNNQDKLDKETLFTELVKRPIKYIPSVILGVLLNILDGLSYGMILFPLANPIFANLGPAGLSMFYVSCVISQLVYSLGGSKFGSGVGSEMIEVVPFFHSMANTLFLEIGEDKPHSVIATTILAFALSSIVTGMVFFCLGYARLGSIIGFFPRHILVGCIGGVGWFLIVTGMEVSSRAPGSLEYNLKFFKWLFEPDVLLKWGTPLGLAFVLVFAQKYTRHPLLVPLYFIVIFIMFHVVIWLVPNLSYQDVRDSGWLFQGPATNEPWWNFYTLYDFKAVDYIALFKTIPAMFALTFFGILHVPINVPALAASIGEDNIDVDRELLAHGISNALSGCLGSIQNYLVYTNSVLFIRSGADSRLSGVMLAIATFMVMVAGPVVIGFIPVMVVGALIFLLGIELIEEALIDTWGRVSKFEYFTIIVIVFTMGAWDFVFGILAGIVLACASFTIQASQTSAIKATFTGTVARSTVRRNATLQKFLFEVGDQIFVLKLTGNIFFGTIVRIEQAVRQLLDDEYFDQQPIRYLVIDMAAVTGLDFSAAEAFARMKRLLDTKSVYMVISSPDEQHMIEALRAVGVLERAYTDTPFYSDSNSASDEEACDYSYADEDGKQVRLFPNLNSALEWCENQFLKDYYIRRDLINSSKDLHNRASSSSSCNSPAFKKSDRSENVAVPSQQKSKVDDSKGIAGSPRVAILHQAADRTVHEDPQVLVSKWQHFKQPLPLLLQTFQGMSTKRETFWHKICPYFKREEVEPGTMLYKANEDSTSFYIVESGVLRADYDITGVNDADEDEEIDGLERSPNKLYEVVLAGTTCGELPFFSNTPRTATVFAETHAVVWKLDRDSWLEILNLKPDGLEIANELYLIALKLTVERFTTITSYTMISSS